MGGVFMDVGFEEGIVMRGENGAVSVWVFGC